MQLERCDWNGGALVFKRPINFRLTVNPFSREAILEQEDLDIYIFAVSCDDAVRQAKQEVGYIWDEYILNQTASDQPSRDIAMQLSSLVASFERHGHALAGG
ncbi:MAG: hypothetical protein R8M38_09875 [Mariprofundaceae bacterium]